MNHVRVLVWFPSYARYYIDILKSAELKYGIICKDKSEFGFEANYTNQDDFNRIIEEYKPDIIFIYNILSTNFVVHIPMGIKVVTYCDHFYEQLSLFGTRYFNQVPVNNYLYMPILNAERLDKDHVLDNADIRKKIYFAPFVDSLIEKKIEKCREDEEKYACDLSVVSHFKNIEYYYWCYNIRSTTMQGRILMQFISRLVRLIRNEIINRETADLDDEWIYRNVKNVFASLDLHKYVKEEDSFIHIWFQAVKFSIISHEYGNIVVDWLIERGYNLKIYGRGWDKDDKYRKHAAGTVEESSDDLRKLYQYSKINVGTNIIMGIHRRNSECIKNGCLCFQAEASPKYMASDYRNFFKDGTDIVVYKNKQELYEKIDYYLLHGQERERIIEAGKNVVKQNLDAAGIVGSIFRKIYES